MEKVSLNRGWQVTEGNLQNPLMVSMLSRWHDCSLPHDYQIAKERPPASPTGENEGWTQGAAIFYRKSFELGPEDAGKRCWLEFEGIAGVCQIWINGIFAAKHLNPYTGILFEATKYVHPGNNTIQIHVDSCMKPNSRWYVGTGLYRSVWMHRSETVTVIPETLHITTKALKGTSALLGVDARISGEAERVTVTLKDSSGTVLAEKEVVPVDHMVNAEIASDHIRPWSPETPELYTVEAAVFADGVTDVSAVRTGIRTISVSPRDGFRLNGVPMKLRGGCIHHDLGLLGAADFKAAERRRIRILKENGFNAVRGAHNPFGPAFYEACDELGMLVIEEAFDEWVLGRTNFGLHITFEDRRERDLEDMVRRDFNHPSIIMWSAGNEVEERDGSADGYAWSRRLAEKLRSLDGTRPISASACSLFIEYAQRPSKDAGKGVTGNQSLNMAYDAFAEGRDLWGPATEECFAPLDVAGYNYKTARYAYDGEKYPNRVIYGSESYPRAAFQSWMSTLENRHVIGDFVWTAWDYIGEVGVGRWEVSDSLRPSTAEYPWLLANCSDIDLLGQKRPQSYYRDIVWGCSKGPKLFCLPPHLTGKNIARLSWGWLPVQRNYTFAGQEGQMIEVHVYADADEVELFQNGVRVGKAPCGRSEEYCTVFTLPYQPGELSAVAHRDGVEIGKDVLCTAGETAALSLTLDGQNTLDGGEDLAFVTVRAVDGNGNHVFLASSELTVNVSGGGTLLALGNADPKPDRTILYGRKSCSLYEGTALAIIRREDSREDCVVECELTSANQELKSVLMPYMPPHPPLRGTFPLWGEG